MAILRVIKREARTLEGMLAYVLEAGKVLYSGGVWVLDIKEPLKEFLICKWAYRQFGGVEYKQIILSFTTEESRLLSPEYLIRVVKEAAEAIAGITAVQIIYAVHGNTDNIHAHFVLNSVSPWTGKKLQITNLSTVQMKLDINNILRKYGLKEIIIKGFERETADAMNNQGRYV